MILNDNNIKILVVDDDEISRQITQMVLEKLCPYKIYTAHSGMKGIEIMNQIDVNLVVLDVAMPIWDGFKTIEIMRKEPKLRSIPVILLTASADLGTVVRANDYGAVDYIKKPFMPEELAERVSKIIFDQWQKPYIKNGDTEEKRMERNSGQRISFNDDEFDSGRRKDSHHRFGDLF